MPPPEFPRAKEKRREAAFSSSPFLPPLGSSIKGKERGLGKLFSSFCRPGNAFKVFSLFLQKRAAAEQGEMDVCGSLLEISHLLSFLTKNGNGFFYGEGPSTKIKVDSLQVRGKKRFSPFPLFSVEEEGV